MRQLGEAENKRVVNMYASQYAVLLERKHFLEARDQHAWTFGKVIEELCLVHAATNIVSQVDGK